MVFIRKQRKAARRMRRKPYVRKALTKPQKAEVKRLIATPQETKYVAATPAVTGGAALVFGYSVGTSIVSGGATSTSWGLIPTLVQGTGGNQRIGNKINNVTFKTTFQFWLNPGIQPSAGLYPAFDYTVKLFILKAKPIKGQQQLINLPVSSLLDNGDATSIDWTATAPVNDMALTQWPVNKEIYTVLKIFEFRLAKNADAATGATGVGAAPNLPAHQTFNCSYTHKHTGNVIYPDNNVVGFGVPENVTLFAQAVYYDTNGAGTAAVPSAVLCTARNHMWYKDA